MTITEQKAFLRSYTGQAQAPADFAQRWQETAAALHPAVSCAPVAFGNPCGVYERLTVTFDGRSVTARVIRPAADGVHPLLLMYHDLIRGVRGWHHMTRFLAPGFGVVAPELHDGIIIPPGARVAQADRLERAVAQRVLPAAGHDLDRHAALKDCTVVKAVDGRFLCAAQLLHESGVLRLIHGTVDVVGRALVVAAGEKGAVHVHALERDDGGNGIVKMQVELRAEALDLGRHGIARERAGRNDDLTVRDGVGLGALDGDVRMRAEPWYEPVFHRRDYQHRR